MEKRAIIAIALSLAVLFIFQTMNKKNAVNEQVMPVKTVSDTSAITQNSGEKPYTADEKYVSQGPAVSFTEKENEIVTDKYRLVFSNIGGTIKKIALNDFVTDEKPEAIIDTSGDIGLFSLNSSQVAGLGRREFNVTEGTGTVEYDFKEPDWIEIKKKYNYYADADHIDVEVIIKNISSRRINFAYQLTGPSDILSGGDKVAGRNFVEADVMIDGKIWKAKSVKGTQERSGIIDWLGIKNRYFTVILKPLSEIRSASMKALPGKKIATSANSIVYDLSPGEEIIDRYTLYAGPLDIKKIEPLGYNMQDIVDYGFFGPVSKLLLSLLRFFYGIVHNWGVAILMLTCVINLLLFPLTAKSFSSMQQMKKIQPHIQKLREMHKDNPQKLNKETMELYRKYNVNPLGGCLPMLLQMPIFISLYQGLMRSIELKGAHFLWIKDLSRPDAVPLPFTLPVLGNSINILPLLMVGMMVVQQKISQGMSAGMSPEQASQQKMMMLMMPLFFGFLFYRMPSGLVLYWLTNTVLMTAEQGYISRRMESNQ